MSKTLYKSDSKPIGKLDKIGTPGSYRNVPIDVEVIAGQRPTQLAKISEHFSKEGRDMGCSNPTFNYALWSPPLVASVTNDAGEEELRLFDGDHRRHMYAMAHPNAETMPAYVVAVKELSDATGLFVKYNKTRRAGISPEQLFICLWHMNNTEAKEFGKILKKVGLRVAADPSLVDPLHCVPPSSSKPHIPFNALQRSVNMCRGYKNTYRAASKPALNLNLAPIQYASDFFSTNFGVLQEIGSEEFQAMVALGFYFPKVTNGSWDKYVSDFMINHFQLWGTRKKAFTHWKERGGDRHRKAAQSIVLGLIDDLSNGAGCPSGLKKYLNNRSTKKKLKS